MAQFITLSTGAVVQVPREVAAQGQGAVGQFERQEELKALAVKQPRKKIVEQDNSQPNNE